MFSILSLSSFICKNGDIMPLLGYHNKELREEELSLLHCKVPKHLKVIFIRLTKLEENG